MGLSHRLDASNQDCVEEDEENRPVEKCPSPATEVFHVKSDSHKY